MGRELNEGEDWDRGSRTEWGVVGGGWPSLGGCGRQREGLCGWGAWGEGEWR